MNCDYWVTKEMPLEADSLLTVFFEKLDEDLIRIHLSNCFESGLIDKNTIEIVNRFGSYTEYDSKGTGITILVRGVLPFVGEVDGKIDFKYTGRKIVYDRVVNNQEAIEWFVRKYALNCGEHYEVEYYKTIPMYPEVTLEGDTLRIKGGEIKQGKRHVTLLSYGGKLLSEGMDMEDVEIKMYDLNILYCAPPLPKGEFEGIVESVKRYAERG